MNSEKSDKNYILSLDVTDPFLNETQLEESDGIALSSSGNAFSVRLHIAMSWGFGVRLNDWPNFEIIKVVIKDPMRLVVHEQSLTSFDLSPSNPTGGPNQSVKKWVDIGPFSIESDGQYDIWIIGSCRLKSISGQFLTIHCEGRVFIDNQLHGVLSVFPTGFAPDNTIGQAYYISKS